MASEGTLNCIDILLAIILPPLGVFLKFGCHVYTNLIPYVCMYVLICFSVSIKTVIILQVEFWICLVLTLCGYLPGIIYAIYAITK
ncbi:Hydrophobic protein LTI6B [Acorus gramineus]|uniref:Hydrophobic protein LTI6B n=1 Tax=Acorus gramineus TaxID=55184 RepID=A0AAV9BYE4_ACOGR|nr:Hydrophobic protein LTI6B [Acorus gramineus]